MATMGPMDMRSKVNSWLGHIDLEVKQFWSAFPCPPPWRPSLLLEVNGSKLGSGLGHVQAFLAGKCDLQHLHGLADLDPALRLDIESPSFDLRSTSSDPRDVHPSLNSDSAEWCNTVCKLSLGCVGTVVLMACIIAILLCLSRSNRGHKMVPARPSRQQLQLSPSSSDPVSCTDVQSPRDIHTLYPPFRHRGLPTPPASYHPSSEIRWKCPRCSPCHPFMRMGLSGSSCSHAYSAVYDTIDDEGDDDNDDEVVRLHPVEDLGKGEETIRNENEFQSCRVCSLPEAEGGESGGRGRDTGQCTHSESEGRDTRQPSAYQNDPQGCGSHTGDISRDESRNYFQLEDYNNLIPGTNSEERSHDMNDSFQMVPVSENSLFTQNPSVPGTDAQKWVHLKPSPSRPTCWRQCESRPTERLDISSSSPLAGSPLRLLKATHPNSFADHRGSSSQKSHPAAKTNGPDQNFIVFSPSRDRQGGRNSFQPRHAHAVSCHSGLSTFSSHSPLHAHSQAGLRANSCVKCQAFMEADKTARRPTSREPPLTDQSMNSDLTAALSPTYPSPDLLTEAEATRRGSRGSFDWTIPSPRSLDISGEDQEWNGRVMFQCDPMFPASADKLHNDSQEIPTRKPVLALHSRYFNKTSAV